MLTLVVTNETLPDPRAQEILDRIVQDDRPWGNFRQFTHNQTTTVKILTVEAGQTLSLQDHAHRDELWVVLDQGLRIELDDRVIEPEPGDEIVIVRGAKHRLSSAGARGRVLEIAFGTFDEDDIRRHDDRYGRD